MAITLRVDAGPRGDAMKPTVALARALQERGLEALEACSGAPPLVACAPYHGLVMAAHIAYAEHYPLVLAPDDVWLCVAQGAARHLLTFPALLQRKLGREAAIELEVRDDSLRPGAPREGWSRVITKLSEQLRTHLGGLHSLLVCDFSTTTAVTRAASEVVLMSAAQRQFTYVVRTLCGIPEVTLLGASSDWRAIVRRARALDELGLEWWTEHLLPVLEALSATARGEDTRAFWREFYKREDASGGERVSGWINALFPYLGDELREGEDGAASLRARVPGGDGARPRPGDFPTGMSGAPLRWLYLDEPRSLQLSAGFVGVTQDPDTLALRPAIAWAIAPPARRLRFQIDREPGDENRARGFVRPREPATLRDLEGLREEVSTLRRFQLTLSGCAELRALELRGLASVRSLYVSECEALERLTLGELPQLETLGLDGCPGLQGLAGLGELPALRFLWLEVMCSLRDLRGVARARALEHISVSDCPGLESLTGVGALPELVSLSLSRCPRLICLKGLELIGSLERLTIDRCAVTSLEGLSAAPHGLFLDELPALRDLNGLGGARLEVLRVEGCATLEELEGLRGLLRLRHVVIIDCPRVTRLDVLASLPALESVTLERLPALQITETVAALPGVELERLRS